MMFDHQAIVDLIEKIRNENDIDKRAELLRSLNAALPKHIQLDIPSLITNDYINFAVYRIEEQLLVA